MVLFLLPFCVLSLFKRWMCKPSEGTEGNNQEEDEDDNESDVESLVIATAEQQRRRCCKKKTLLVGWAKKRIGILSAIFEKTGFLACLLRRLCDASIQDVTAHDLPSLVATRVASYGLPDSLSFCVFALALVSRSCVEDVPGSSSR